MSKLEKVAAIIWSIIFIITIPHCYLTKKSTKEFLAEPHVGDLYVVKVAHIKDSGYEDKDSRLVGIMKLIEIDENLLTFIISKKAYSRRASLRLIKEYSDHIIHLQRNDVWSLYNKDIIEEVRK